MSQDAPRISVRHLTKVFRTRRGDTLALDDVSLDVAEAEILVLLGPSGCGKTTLLRCLAGLETPDSGEITVHSRTVFSSEKQVYVPPEQRHLSMVFQSYALWPHMTVADNVAYPLQNVGVNRREIEERVTAVLGVVGLAGFLGAYPGQLSGGQQQRVALARAIVSNEGVILFDEPLSNLDAKVRERIRIELLALHHDIRFSGVYVTHDQTEATALAGRLAVMQAGQIAQAGTPTEMYYAPATRFVAGFIGSANEVTGTVLAVDATGYRVQTPLGPLAARASAGDGLRVGADVTVVFRPEHCRIDVNPPTVAQPLASAPSEQAGRMVSRDDVPSGPSEDGVNRMVAIVERSMFLGSYMEYVVRVADVPLVARAMGGEVLAEGREVLVRLAAEHARVFAAD